MKLGRYFVMFYDDLVKYCKILIMKYKKVNSNLSLEEFLIKELEKTTKRRKCLGIIIIDDEFTAIIPENYKEVVEYVEFLVYNNLNNLFKENLKV